MAMENTEKLVMRSVELIPGLQEFITLIFLNLINKVRSASN